MVDPYPIKCLYLEGAQLQQFPLDQYILKINTHDAIGDQNLKS